MKPVLKTSEMVLRAPGMLALHVALDRVEADFREMGRALTELASYFADLDRRAVGR